MNRHLHVTRINKIEKDFRTTVFIGNLPYVSDEEEIWEIFNEFGEVDFVWIVRDKYTNNKCWLTILHNRLTDSHGCNIK